MFKRIHRLLRTLVYNPSHSYKSLTNTAVFHSENPEYPQSNTQRYVRLFAIRKSHPRTHAITNQHRTTNHSNGYSDSDADAQRAYSSKIRYFSAARTTPIL